MNQNNKVNDMETKFKLKENIIRLGVHVGYFISLFIVGLILTYIVIQIALQVMLNRDLTEMITWAGIIVFVTISLIDTLLVFNGKLSPAIIVLVLPFVLLYAVWHAVKYAFDRMPLKTIFETIKEIFKAGFVVNDSGDNAINSIANGLYKKYH